MEVKKTGDPGEGDQKEAPRRQGYPGPEINQFRLAQKNTRVWEADHMRKSNWWPCCVWKSMFTKCSASS